MSPTDAATRKLHIERIREETDATPVWGCVQWPYMTDLGARPSELKRRFQVRALAFDAYGTLFDVHSVLSTAEALFPGHGKAVSDVWRTAQLRYTWLRSLMGQYSDFEHVTLDALTYACNSLDIECGSEQRARLLDAYSHLNPFAEVPAALRNLSGLPLAILSNGTSKMLRAVVHNAGLGDLFTGIFSADEVRIYKPAPAVYQMAISRFQAEEPSQIGFVSSNAWDVAGATAFGFTTFWINRGAASGKMEELGVVPAAIIQGLDQLVPMLSSSESAART
jgi:2-haloacid dehalogenase